MTTLSPPPSQPPIADPGPHAPTHPHQPTGIPYGFLTALALTFIAGLIVALMYSNVQKGEQVVFSTPSLLGFFFGIALSSASIVLAIAAIALGRTSEQALVQRSDESIRLQNEVFVRTTDALARIESSTGVTEKRIEDIISGRAGDLSHAIAERLSSKATGKTKDREALEREIRQSLLEELTSGRDHETQAAHVAIQRQTKEANKAYRRFQSDLLVALSNSSFAKCEKIGDGTFTAAGEDLVDAIVLAGKHRVAVSTFSTRKPLGAHHLVHFPEFLQALAEEIQGNKFHQAILAFDGELRSDSPFRKHIERLKPIIKPDVAQRIDLFDGPGNESIEKTMARLRSLAEGANGPKLGTIA